MVDYSGSTPIVLIRTEIQPDAADYLFWIKTSTNEVFSSDGSNWSKVTVKLGELQTPILEQALEILQIQASQTLTATDSAFIIMDLYSDSTGYKNTISGSSTAYFEGDTFFNGTFNKSGDFGTTSSSGSGVGKWGIKITPKTDISLKEVTLYSACNASYVLLTDDSNNVIETAAVVSNVATFSGTTLLNGTSYRIFANNGDSVFDNRFKSTTLPSDSTDFTINAGVDNDGNLSYSGFWNIRTFKYSKNHSDLFVLTNEQTLTFTPTNFQIFTYKGSVSGTGSINYDISFDGGSNYQTLIDENTPTPITDLGTGLILKQNLNAGASSGKASAKGYGVLIW